MSNFQNQVKASLSKAHKKLLDGGNQDLTNHGKPFSQDRPVDNSNAFVAKENTVGGPSRILDDFMSAALERGVDGNVDYTIFLKILDQDGPSAATQYVSHEMSDSDDGEGMDIGDLLDELEVDLGHELQEISTSASVGGYGGPGKKRKKLREGLEMQSREEIVNELKVRKAVSHMLELQKKRNIKQFIEEYTDHFRLRGLVSKLIRESDVEKNPHGNTGINKLEELLKKIIPTLEDSYKALTSNKEQRTSFRRHILNAIENAIRPEDTNARLDSDEKAQDIEEVEIKINTKRSDPLGASEEDKFIDISDSEGGDTEEEEDPLDSFGIEGEDTTGRNEAFAAFKQIENQIVDTYAILQDENDREVFYDYLLTNIKMYFDKFEEEIMPVVDEPSSDSYEEDPGDSELPEKDPLKEI